jgi:hypothetical protein
MRSTLFAISLCAPRCSLQDVGALQPENAYCIFTTSGELETTKIAVRVRSGSPETLMQTTVQQANQAVPGWT